MDPQTQERVNNAKFIFKFFPNKGVTDREWKAMEAKCLEDLSIGIDYGMTESFLDCLSKEDIKRGLIGLYPELSQRSGSPGLINMFLNEMNVGDEILIGRGAQNILYVATIASCPYFTKNSKWTQCEFRFLENLTALFHRRHIINIKRLPSGITCNKKCQSTIHKINNSFEFN